MKFEAEVDRKGLVLAQRDQMRPEHGHPKRAAVLALLRGSKRGRVDTRERLPGLTIGETQMISVDTVPAIGPLRSENPPGRGAGSVLYCRKPAHWRASTHPPKTAFFYFAKKSKKPTAVPALQGVGGTGSACRAGIFGEVK